MSNLQTYNIENIRHIDPCYDPVTGKNREGVNSVHQTGFLPEDWEGTLVDILKVRDCPAEDRLWVVSRFLDTYDGDRILRLLAVWSARNVLSAVENPHPVLVAAVDIAEKYANRTSTDIELSEARTAVTLLESEDDELRCVCLSLVIFTPRHAMLNTVEYAVRFWKNFPGEGPIRFTWEDHINHLIEMLEEDDWIE